MTIKWSSASGPTTALASGKLSGLANNTLCSQSAAIANNTGRNMYTDWELNFPASGAVTVSQGKYCVLYIQAALATASFPSPSRKSNEPLVIFPLATGSIKQRVVRRGIMVTPGAFKVALDNQTGVTFPTSAVTVKYITYNVATG